MQIISSIRWLAVEERSEAPKSAAVLIAGGLLALAMATGSASVSLTSLAIRQAVAPGLPAPARTYTAAELAPWSTVRFLTVAHRAPKAPVLGQGAPAPRAPEVTAPVQSAELDSIVPVAEAVKASGLLAALLSMEAEGDTTQTSEGLESIASPAAVAVALSGAGPDAFLTETVELPRMDSERLLAAPGVDAAPVEIREISLQIPETPARNNLNPAGSSFSS